ncbi:unnamed protein product [Cercospora beticola]|nr:unnamed protein product [Cercospora beticola]
MMEGLNVAPHKPDCKMVGAPGTSPFNELPPELFELIAEHSDTATLRALRLTCRDFAAKVLSTYGQAHFTSRSLLLFKLDSIQTAARAAEHPVFGRHLRQLVIIVDDVVAYPGCASCQSASTMLSRIAELTRLFRSFLSRRIELQLELIDQKAKGMSWICFASPNCTSCHSKTHFTTHWTGWDAPWTQVLSAVREAGVETLSMAIKAETWMLQMSNQSILAPSRALFLDALQHMRHLDVHVAALRDESDYEQGARDFLSIISSAKTLETFKVRMQEGLGRRIRELRIRDNNAGSQTLFFNWRSILGLVTVAGLHSTQSQPSKTGSPWFRNHAWCFQRRIPRRIRGLRSVRRP